MKKEKINLMIATVTGGGAPRAGQPVTTAGAKSTHQIENAQVLTTGEMEKINNAGERCMWYKW